MRSAVARAALVAALAAVGGVGLTPAAPPAAVAAEPEARYDPVTLTLHLNPAPGSSVPVVTEGKNPPRLVVEWRGTWGIVPRALIYAAGPVYRFEVLPVGDRTRVTLTFRAPLDGGWDLRFGPNGTAAVKLFPNEPEMTYVRPMPKRTPRPAPMLPGYRVTPAPVFPLAPTPRPLPGWAQPRPLPPAPTTYPGDRHPVPAPYGSVLPYQAPPSPPPVAAPTPAPVAVATPTPQATPVPAPVATPVPTPEPVVEAPGLARPVFGSGAWLGAEVPIGLAERYPAPGVDSSVPFALGAGFGWDHMFSEHVGLALAGRSYGFTLDDDATKARGFEVKHKREDYELGAGIRGRLAFGGGFEGMLQPGFLLRAVRATSSHALISGGTAGAAVDVDTTDYLSAPWLAYGGAVRTGVGWRAGSSPFALVTFGEVRYLADGQVLAKGVAPFFPLFGWRAGGEARLDLEGWGLSAGYALGKDTHTGASATDTLEQDVGGAYVRAHWLY